MSVLTFVRVRARILVRSRVRIVVRLRARNSKAFVLIPGLSNVPLPDPGSELRNDILVSRGYQ